MKVIAIIIALVIVGLTLAVIAAKKGWLSDRDGDGLPDVIEDKVDDVKEAIEDKVEDVKESIEDVVDNVKEAIAKPTRKKPGRKKKQTTKSTEAPKSTKGYYKSKRQAKK